MDPTINMPIKLKTPNHYMARHWPQKLFSSCQNQIAGFLPLSRSNKKNFEKRKQIHRRNKKRKSASGDGGYWFAKRKKRRW